VLKIELWRRGSWLFDRRWDACHVIFFIKPITCASAKEERCALARKDGNQLVLKCTLEIAGIRTGH